MASNSVCILRQSVLAVRNRPSYVLLSPSGTIPPRSKCQKIVQASLRAHVSRRDINTSTPIVDNAALPDALLDVPPQQAITSNPSEAPRPARTQSGPSRFKPNHATPKKIGHSPRYDLSRAPDASSSVTTQSLQRSSPTSTQSSTSTSTSTTQPSDPPFPSQPPTQTTHPLSPTVLSNLPHLLAQSPHYITVHIHGRPYLVTAGDTVRLPFLMHGVMPGDILRLDRASTLGSRDWTLSAGFGVNDVTKLEQIGSAQQTGSADQGGQIIGKTEGLETSSRLAAGEQKLRPRQQFLDDRLFVCRATVLGAESEPMRVKEKTKPRQRRIKKVKSKLRFTMLRIGEVRIRDVGELQGDVAAEP